MQAHKLEENTLYKLYKECISMMLVSLWKGDHYLKRYYGNVLVRKVLDKACSDI